MAELPELETVRRELEKEAVGKRFKVPEVTGAKVVRHNGNKKVFQARLEGAKVKSVDRKGRLLVGNLDNGELLVIDLGEGGRLEKFAPKDPPAKHTFVVFSFTQGGQIRLVDPSGTAQVFVVANDALADEVPSVASAGLDPVADTVSWTSFARLILSKNVKLKALLMDPTVVAAIGPIYSDEILWEAGLRHDRISSELSSQEIRRLFRALVETLHDAVKHRGSTVDEFPFVDLYGKPGDHQDELRVFGREGEPCRRCRAPIAKARYANRPLYYCEECQV
ncbi:MAG: DNA-formamidopyrimidine glycosylase family protein [Acidimicrobiales bacterium]